MLRFEATCLEGGRERHEARPRADGQRLAAGNRSRPQGPSPRTCCTGSHGAPWRGRFGSRPAGEHTRRRLFSPWATKVLTKALMGPKSSSPTRENSRVNLATGRNGSHARPFRRRPLAPHIRTSDLEGTSSRVPGPQPLLSAMRHRGSEPRKEGREERGEVKHRCEDARLSHFELDNGNEHTSIVPRGNTEAMQTGNLSGRLEGPSSQCAWCERTCQCQRGGASLVNAAACRSLEAQKRLP